MHALGEESAVVVGHDWDATVAASSALLRPDVFHAVALLCALLLAGCAEPDRTEIVTWTDEHGQACTGVAVVDSEDGDREVTGIDCDHPPEGRQPGRETSAPLPG